MENVKEKIIGIAKKLHIDLIGFTSIADCEEVRPILLDRESKGYLSGLEEKDLEKRIRPRQVFPQARSIISIGLSYHYKWDKPERGELRGKISKSSWGRDYHVVLTEKMEQLMQQVGDEIMPMKYRAFADTGPLVDRALAYRAGIGSFGKNGFIIHPDYGSFIFIGNILVDKAIEEDPRSQEDICGACARCIAACPTGALERPFEFNAQKCISYLTQKKELLEDHERRFIGNHIYGCDLCQMACPHNKGAKYTENADFKPHPDWHFPKLADLLFMTNQEFKQTFRNIAAGWRGKKILQRNAIIALGNSKDQGAIPLLKTSLKDERWDIRLYTVWALQQHGEKGKTIIKEWMRVERHPQVLKEIKKMDPILTPKQFPL